MFSSSGILLLLVVYLASNIPLSGATSAPSLVVKTANGTLVGAHSAYYNQDFFLNVPYAAPPIGDLRFNAPEPYNLQYQNRDASQYGPACFGYNSFAAISQVYSEYSEDCLQLNIVRPSNESCLLPVMVWIHGGGFQFGSGIDTRYNTSYLVQQSTQIGAPIIGITINYRLGPWGYLASQDVLSDGGANAGLRDQRKALHWIKENIVAFGGDPEKITIMGESAGATSVGYQILAYSGNNDNLFYSAIMESGSPINPTEISDVSFYQPIYDALVQQLGCGRSSGIAALQCLRNTPGSELQATLATAPYNTSFNPLIDGIFLPYYPSVALAKGAFARIPILIGTNTDDGTLFTPAFAPYGIANDSQFAKTLQLTGNLTEADIQTLSSLYPNDPALGSPYNTGNDSAAFPPTLGAQFKRGASYVGDFMFIANKRHVAQTFANYGLPVYSYRFNTLTTSSLPNIIFGVYHTTEIAFVFHNLQGVGYRTGDPFANQPPSYTALSDYMSHLWIGFIAHGSPNSVKSEGLPCWPEYGATASNLVFQPNSSYVEKDDFRSEQLNFINGIPSKYMR